MSLVAFADESGTTSGTACYAIGVVSVDDVGLSRFETRCLELLHAHGVQGEAKWTKVRTSHGLTNFVLGVLDLVLTGESTSFDVIVVNKALFRNWRNPRLGQEGAFYQTYTYLLRHLVRRARQTATVYIDDRSDRYPKQNEVVEAIGNAILAQLHQTGRLQSVRKVPSRDYIGIQVADVLTGAVWAAHERRLDSTTPLNRGKIVTIERLASMLGWDDLCYDTMPSSKLNVWHFPTDYRADPATRMVAKTPVVPYVRKDEIA